MEIEFELVDNQTINVVGIHTLQERVKGDDGQYKLESKVTRKVIGNIFTPSGSGHTYKNAIQICGFTEAFDLWGCANYQTYKISKNGIEFEKVKPKTYSFPYELLDAFDQETRVKLISIIRAANMKEQESCKDDKVIIQCKDIQLRFPYPQESICSKDKGWAGNFADTCWSCFNKECTCENKGKHQNPFDVKRSSDLHLERVEKDKPFPNLI